MVCLRFTGQTLCHGERTVLDAQNKAAKDLLVLVHFVSRRARVTVVICRVVYGDLYQKTTESPLFEMAESMRDSTSHRVPV
ncbi:hypothetical protein HDF14_001572 [Edaphobacter lichenicola]|uniref:Uncharacterized protein n=1 Tax=Tunturiibacter gelidiferens TaxID=3069689 RepID=A0A9X0U324_9BACT|nr:hypothetical protein [Edaphobacter lichenicola]